MASWLSQRSDLSLICLLSGAIAADPQFDVPGWHGGHRRGKAGIFVVACMRVMTSAATRRYYKQVATQKRRKDLAAMAAISCVAGDSARKLLTLFFLG